MKALLFSFVLLFSFEASTNVQVEPKELFAKKRDVRADSPGCKSIKSTKEKKRGYKIKSAGTSLNKYEDKRYVKGFYCHQCKENAKSDGPIKLKNDLVWEHTSNGDKVKDDITANHYKCTEVVNKYVCFIKNGGKRVKAVKVGSTKHTNLSSSDNHTVGKVEYSSKADAKAETGAKTKECVPAEEKFVCYIKNGGKRVKAVKVGSTKHTNLSSSDKHIVGKVEYASKADAKEEKGAETKECVEGKTETEFACYYCNPKKFDVLQNKDTAWKQAIEVRQSSEFIGRGRGKIKESKWNKKVTSDEKVKLYRFAKQVVGKAKWKEMYTYIRGKRPTWFRQLKNVLSGKRDLYVACEFGEEKGTNSEAAMKRAYEYAKAINLCPGDVKDCGSYTDADHKEVEARLTKEGICGEGKIYDKKICDCRAKTCDEVFEPGKLSSVKSSAVQIPGDYKSAEEMKTGVDAYLASIKAASTDGATVNVEQSPNPDAQGNVTSLYTVTKEGVSCFAKSSFKLGCDYVKAHLNQQPTCADRKDIPLAEVSGLSELAAIIKVHRDEWYRCYERKKSTSPVPFELEKVFNDADQKFSANVKVMVNGEKCDERSYSGDINLTETTLVFPEGPYKWLDEFDYVKQCKKEINTMMNSWFGDDWRNNINSNNHGGWIKIKIGSNGECIIGKYDKGNWYILGKKSPGGGGPVKKGLKGSGSGQGD